MELRHLRYFVVVAEELNFRAAADRLHVSHPALSKQIKDLEYELGVQLLGRNTVKVWLTDSGKQFLKDSKNILKQVDQACVTAKKIHDKESILTIGSAGPFWDIIVFKLLKDFKKKYPDVDLHVIERAPWDQIKSLQHGEYQLAFVGQHESIDSPTLNKLYLTSSPFGVIAGKDHPLSNKQTVSWDDLKNENICCFGKQRSSHHLKDIRSMLPPGSIKSKQLKDANSISAMISMITSGQGITFFPKSFAESRKNIVTYIPLENARNNCYFELWAVWRKSDHSTFLKDFVETMKKNMNTNL